MVGTCTVLKGMHQARKPKTKPIKTIVVALTIRQRQREQNSSITNDNVNCFVHTLHEVH